MKRFFAVLAAVSLISAPTAAQFNQCGFGVCPSAVVSGGGGPSSIGRGQVAARVGLHGRIVFEGDSITAGSSGPTYVQFALTQSGGRLFAPAGYNQATGGQTAAQMAGQVAAVTGLAPKVVVYLSGTNDLSGTADTPATIFANQRTAVNAYKAAGAVVVFVGTLPRNDATWLALSGARQADRTTLLNLQRAQSDVRFVDLEASFNPTTMTVDGLHPNYLGAITIGTAVGNAIAAATIETSVLVGYDTAANFLVGAAENPTFTGTGGSGSGTPTPTGTIPTNWVVSQNDALTVVSSVTTLNGRPAVRLQVSGTNSTSGRVVNLQNTVTYPGQAGEFWEMWWDFSLASGSANLRAISASTDTAAMPNVSSPEVYPTNAVAGVLRPPMNAALAGVDTTVTIQGTLVFAAGVVAADITWAAPFYRRVPSGQ